MFLPVLWLVCLLIHPPVTLVANVMFSLWFVSLSVTLHHTAICRFCPVLEFVGCSPCIVGFVLFFAVM